MFNFIKYLIKNPSISGIDAQKNSKNKEYVFLDVRELDERKINNISKSLYIPIGQLKGRITELESYKGKKVIVFCATGSRSKIATALLNSNGYNSFNLTGGIGEFK